MPFIPHTADDVREVLRRALEHEAPDGAVRIDAEALATLSRAADGDARRALNLLEVAPDLARAGDGAITEAIASEISAGGYRRFDKKGEQFYDQISALHKSVRGSDPDAALYWLCRMLDGGSAPSDVARRVQSLALHDVGTAAPRAVAGAAWCCLRTDEVTRRRDGGRDRGAVRVRAGRHQP